MERSDLRRLGRAGLPVRVQRAMICLFYLVTLPEFYFVKFAGESVAVALVCPFLMFLPLGFLLGPLSIWPPERRESQRGFPRHDKESQRSE